MSTPDIIKKLTKELENGITSEVQVVYLMAQIRKLMERDQIENKYVNLKFHCDWTLHSQLHGETAHQILRMFDAAYPVLKDTKGKLQDELPNDLRANIDRLSEMRLFEEEFSVVLGNYGLPPLTVNCKDGWVYFLYLYARVIEEIPLEVRVSRADAAKNVSKVVLKVRRAGEKAEIPFRLIWEIHDKNGDIFAISTFKQHESTGEAADRPTA
jgi:hypothetical protein